MNGKILLSDKHWRVSENTNDGMENCFLEVDGRCVGGIDQDFPSLKWRATVDAQYDPITGSDVYLIGEYDDFHEALAALWDNKELAL